MQESQNLRRDLTQEERTELVIRRLALRAKGNARERAAAAQLIGTCCSCFDLPLTEQVVDILLDLLRDEEVTVRRASATELMLIANCGLRTVERRDQVFGPLLRAAEGDPDPEVRSDASKAVDYIREMDKFGWGGSEWGSEERDPERSEGKQEGVRKEWHCRAQGPVFARLRFWPAPFAVPDGIGASMGSEHGHPASLAAYLAARYRAPGTPTDPAGPGPTARPDPLAELERINELNRRNMQRLTQPPTPPQPYRPVVPGVVQPPQSSVPGTVQPHRPQPRR